MYVLVGRVSLNVRAFDNNDVSWSHYLRSPCVFATLHFGQSVTLIGGHLLSVTAESYNAW